MNPRHPLREARSDRVAARHAPDTAQTRHPAYRLAFADEDFLCREELRPVRLQLELLKPQMHLDELGINSTVVLFGGSRIPSPAMKETARTKTLSELSCFYEERIYEFKIYSFISTYSENTWPISPYERLAGIHKN